MAQQFKITSTGTKTTLTYPVLGIAGPGALSHPVVDLDLLLEHNSSELAIESQLQADIDAGHITVKDENNNSVTDVSTQATVESRIVRISLRNESGSSIPKGILVAVSGFNGTEERPTVVIADKDDAAKRPVLAVTEATIANNTNFEGLVIGILTGLNTSSFSENDQLTLGDAGAVSRPPPDIDPFTGEIQLVGSSVRIDATNGSVFFNLASGLLPMTAAQFFVTKEISPTGSVSGGEVTRATGLNVDITSGSGFVNDDTDIFRVIWTAVTNLALTANNTNFIFVDKNGLVQSSISSPSLGNNIILASAITDGSSVLLLSNHKVILKERPAGASEYVKDVVGNIVVSGVITSKDAIALRLEVDAGTFYTRAFRVTVPATDPITFTYWFRDGSGGFTRVASSTLIDNNNWDDSTGTLNSLVAGEWKKDLLFVVSTSTGAVEYHVFYGQEVFTSQSEAEAGNVPAADGDVLAIGVRSGGIVIEGAAATIASVVDVRPFLGQLSPGTTAVTDHGLLGGLGDDDHGQYLLINGLRAMTGDLDMGTKNITNVGTVDGVTVSDAIHDNVAGEINAITEKPTPVNADLILIEDSAASFVKKRIQIGNLPGGPSVDTQQFAFVPFFTTTATSDVLVTSFIFKGTATHTISNLKVIIGNSDVDVSTAATVKDFTNSLNVIASATSTTGGVKRVLDLGAISNLPTGEAVFELFINRASGVGGDTAEVHAILITY